MSEVDLSRLLAASGLERAELATEHDRQQITEVDRLRNWLDSDPELTDQQRDGLRGSCATMRRLNEKRLQGLVESARIASTIFAEVLKPEHGIDDRVAALNSQAAALESIAMAARLAAATVLAIEAVERQVPKEGA
jgi:hypothetical protein